MTTTVVEAPPLDDALTGCPYRGLRPYSEEDYAFFFGREAEREIIAANLIAARLTILYGASGVGKSSVLQAGVEHDLWAMARENRAAGRGAEYVTVVMRDWGHDPMVELRARIRASVTAIYGAEAPPEPEGDVLEGWTRVLDAGLLIVLDQFEEYLLYHSADAPFGRDLARAVTARELPVNFLVGIREDALAGLDHFKGRIPGLFDNYLRIDHLAREAARTAITGPLEEYNRRGGEMSADAELVEGVLDQVATGRVTLGRAGRGGASEDSGRVETPLLQLVMTRLWERERDQGSSRLRRETLAAMGGAEQIVRTHLDGQLSKLPHDEQDIAADAFHHLVTPSGTKIAHTVRDLADYAEVPEERLRPVLARLSESDSRILRPVPDPADPTAPPRYEIFHDVLAEAVLDWRARHDHERHEAEAVAKERKRQHGRLLRVVFGFVLLGIVVSTALAVYAFQQGQRASREADRATARELAASSQGVLTRDSELAVLLAVEAMRADDGTAEAVSALRAALAEYHGRGRLDGHEGRVWDVDFSPDGERAVSAGQDGTARLWSAAAQRTISVLSGHRQPVYSARFSRDGTRVVTASQDTTARVWDGATGAFLFALEGHRDGINRALFDPHDALIATAGLRGELRLWRARDGTPLARLDGHRGAVRDIEFDPGGRRLVSAGEDATARIWDVGSGRAVVLRHADEVSSARFSPDGELVVTASADGTARLWRARDGSPAGVLRAPTRAQNPFVAMLDARFSPSGRHVVTASDDFRAHVWRTDRGELVNTLRGHGGSIRYAAFDPEGRVIVTASDDGTARVWSAKTGRALTVLRGHEGFVTRAAFNPRAPIVATVGEDGGVRLWHLDKLAVEATLDHPLDVSTSVFDRSGRLVVTAGGDGVARTFDWRTGEERPPVRESYAVRTADISADGRLIVTATGSPEDRARRHGANVWDARKGQLVGPLEGVHTESVASAAFSPDGSRIVTSGADGTAVVWSARTREPVTRLAAAELERVERPDRGLSDAQFSPDGRLVVTAGNDGVARVWDVRSRKVVELLDAEGGGEQDAFLDDLVTAVFGPGGRTVVTSSFDATARVWNLREDRQQDLTGHDDLVSSAAVSPDGRIVATSSVDGTIRLWDAAAGTTLAEAQVSEQPVWSVAFSRDGRWLTAALAGREVRVYRCDICGTPADLLEQSRRVPRPLTAEERRRFLHED